MDSNKFNALLKAVEFGSLTKAADTLGYTQAGLTHMMTRLENEIGIKLLKRTKFGVELTSDGKQLLPLIKSFTSEGEKLQRAINRISNGNDSVIRIAAYASIASHWLPIVINRFTAENPDIRVEVNDGNIGEIRDMVTNDEVEIGFASHDKDFKDEWIHLYDDPLLAILPANNDVSTDCVPLSFFEGKHFFIPTHGVDYDVLNLLADNNITPNVSEAVLNDSSVVSMVSHGLGYSILSRLIITDMGGNYVSKPLFPEAHRELGMMIKSKASLSPAAHKFINCCKKTVKELIENQQ